MKCTRISVQWNGIQLNIRYLFVGSLVASCCRFPLSDWIGSLNAINASPSTSQFVFLCASQVSPDSPSRSCSFSYGYRTRVRTRMKPPISLRPSDSTSSVSTETAYYLSQDSSWSLRCILPSKQPQVLLIKSGFQIKGNLSFLAMPHARQWAR